MFETNAKLAEIGNPGMRIRDEPAMLPEPLPAFYAGTSYTGRVPRCLR
ncbi:hypothetical protein [Paraburkholderia dinghuensis]|nr:hypothetical protein [Paraburkholderia dinghuensis]